MNRSNLRALPSPATSPEDAAQAQAELTGLFTGLLARAEQEEESPDYDLLEAAVDGTLDPVEAERFASRLAGDPVLEREFADLVALRDRLERSPARQKSGTRAPSGRRWLGIAAAAVLVCALGLGLRMSQREQPTQLSQLSQPARPAAEAQSGSNVLFADSFEGGSIEHWSN